MASSSRTNPRKESVVVDCGRRRTTCGYCRSPRRSSISHGLWAHSLTVDDYQGLLDRGWRRSGCFLYKPEMERTCCPSYTIRLKASDFVPSKEQVRVSRRLQRACNGHINFYAPTEQVCQSECVQSAETSKKSGMKRDIGGNCLSSPPHCQVKKRKFEIRMNRSSFDPEEFALYRRYQLKVHNDKPDHVTETSYRRFLVDTPLLFVSPTGDSTVPPCGFGSFHQQYLIDGKLVAVGVIDVLPKCLSSKYLFWDPDFAFLSLGKYSALQEIGWVKENQAHCPSLQYYYLGYYIHSCNKMRYKASYRPSELLCPLRYQFLRFKKWRFFPPSSYRRFNRKAP